VTARVLIAFAAAAGENGVIGAGGRLPWKLPSDLKQFRKLTLGKPIVMGRKTYQSIGKPLDGRDNIVVTRDRTFAAAGVHVAFSLADALILGRQLAAGRGATEVVVIGGAEIFRAALAQADRVYLTRVHGAPPGDTYLDPLDPTVWLETKREAMVGGPGDQYAADFITLDRKR
jgi:dihydrofolate reductase